MGIKSVNCHKIFLRLLRLLPFLSLACAYPRAYTEFFKDFPEARALTGFTFFQTTKGLFYKVRNNLGRNNFDATDWCRIQLTPTLLMEQWSSPRVC